MQIAPQTTTHAKHAQITTLPSVPTCPECGSTSTLKKGKRKTRLRHAQLYQCVECLHRFAAGDPAKNRTYPLKVILDAISLFNIGNSLTETQRILQRRFHVSAPERTISTWLKAYKPLATFWRLRAQAKKLFDPRSIIREQNLDHRQVYRFQIHQAKLKLLLDSPDHQRLAPIRPYLDTVTGEFPHELFRNAEHRSSTFPAELRPQIARKENAATRSAGLVLPTSPSNKKRHETLQRFMLINDSVTIAVEIPVYLTPGDIAGYRAQGFDLNFGSATVTGHIDFLQVRNGYLHILDYKPEAKKERHAHVQLTLYALALARRANLPVRFLKCAWFDEKDYFEFFPLTGVRGLKPVSADLNIRHMKASCSLHEFEIKLEREAEPHNRSRITKTMRTGPAAYSVFHKQCLRVIQKQAR